MKVLVTGDKHLGLVSDGESRLEEQRRVLGRCLELLKEFNPDVYVDLGDLFHGPRPGPDAYAVALSYLCSLAEWSATSSNPAFLLAGNHDKTTRGSVTALDPFVPIRGTFPHFPEVVFLPKTAAVGEFVCVFIPFVTEWEAKANGRESAQAWLDDGSEQLEHKTRGRRLLVFTHLEVPGSKIHEWETTQRDVGLHIPSAILENPRVERVYAGHVHRHQELERVTVVGSSIHVDFGEASDEKGVVLVEVS